MKRLALLAAALATLPGFGWYNGCGKKHFSGTWFARVQCSQAYTTPGGISWVIYGPTAPNNLNVDNPPDGIETIDPAVISAAIDAQVAAVAAQYPNVNVWGAARGVPWKLVNDYTFPDGSANGENVGDSTTGYAAGETAEVGGVAVFVVFALWTRINLPDGAPAPDPATLQAPWTLRGPGVDGYTDWRYGGQPYLPAVGYELRVNVLHVSNN